jgi:mitochondrial fission protein ELM1
MTTTELRVLVVRDGRPGHEKQSLGLVAALEREYCVRRWEVRVKPGYKAIIQSFSLLVGPLPRELARFTPDLILGTGSHTHFPILALKRRLGGRTVVCMSPMRCIRNQFDLCCIPRHDGVAEKKNILLTDGPPGVNSDQGRHDPHAALVLVGGVDEKSHTWKNNAIADHIVTVLARHPEYSWRLTTSPRTPADFLDTFALHRKEIPVQICPFGQTPSGWLERELQVASWVLFL